MWLTLNQEHSSDNYSPIKVILGHDYFGCAIRKSAQGCVTQSIPPFVHQRLRLCRHLSLTHEMIFPQTDLCLNDDWKTTEDVGGLGWEADLHIRSGDQMPQTEAFPFISGNNSQCNEQLACAPVSWFILYYSKPEWTCWDLNQQRCRNEFKCLFHCILMYK